MSRYDRTFALGSVCLCIASIPAITGHITAPAWSAAITSGVLLMFATCYLAMRLRFAGITVAIQALLWISILIRAIH